MDIQIVTDAYKKYARYKDKNLNQLMEFSKLARVEGKVRRYMEVLIIRYLKFNYVIFLYLTKLHLTNTQLYIII